MVSSVLVVVGVRQADLDVVRVLDIMPMAWWRGYSLLVLYGYRHFNIHRLHGRSLLGNFYVLLNRHVNLNRNHLRYGDSAFLKNLNLHRHVDHDLFLDLEGDLNLDHLINDSRDLVFFLNVNNLGYLMSNSLEDCLWLLDLNFDLYHGWHLNGNSFDVVFGHHGFVNSRYELDFGG